MVQCHKNDRFHQTTAPELGGSVNHSTCRSTFDDSGANFYMSFPACHLYEHHLSLTGHCNKKAIYPVLFSFDPWAYEKKVVYALATSTQCSAPALVKSRPSPDDFHTVSLTPWRPLHSALHQRWSKVVQALTTSTQCLPSVLVKRVVKHL